MDVFGYFKYAKKKELTFDMIILDPPSFARNKKKVFSVAKNYGELVTDSLAIMNEEGLLIASTNAANLSQKKQWIRHKSHINVYKNIDYQVILQLILTF